MYSVVGSLFSKTLNNSRDVIVYTPPSYYENTLKTIKNVLVMHDGQVIFNDSTSVNGVSMNCHKTIDKLVSEGNMEEVLVVGLYRTSGRSFEYTFAEDPFFGIQGKGDLYLDFIQNEAIPFVAQKFRVLTGRENMGIMGLSLGGLISCYAGWTRSEFYKKIGCISPFWEDVTSFNNDYELS